MNVYKKLAVLLLMCGGSILPSASPHMQTVQIGKTTLVLTSHHERDKADAAIIAMDHQVITAQKMIDQNIMPLKLMIINDGDQPIAVGIDGIKGIPVVKSAEVARLFGEFPAIDKAMGFFGTIGAAAGGAALYALYDAFRAGRRERWRRDDALNASLVYIGIGAVASSLAYYAYREGKALAGNKDLLHLLALNDWQEILPGQKVEKLIFVPCSHEDRTMQVTVLAKKGEAVEQLQSQFTVPALEMTVLPTVYY